MDGAGRCVSPVVARCYNCGTPCGCLSPGVVPLACLFVGLSAMTDCWATCCCREALWKLVHGVMFYVVVHVVGTTSPHVSVVSIDCSQPSFVVIECLWISCGYWLLTKHGGMLVPLRRNATLKNKKAGRGVGGEVSQPARLDMFAVSARCQIIFSV